MNWRQVQLENDLCDQDQKILEIVNGRKVRLHGNHQGFDQFVDIDHQSDFAIILFTNPIWLSQIKQQLDEWVNEQINFVYIGVNRYCLLGNDTFVKYYDGKIKRGQQIINALDGFLTTKNFIMKNHGMFDDDQGRYFNFVQPLTWIYCERETDRSQ
jgi:hypothetical protein